jgi:hypothetical protein
MSGFTIYYTDGGYTEFPHGGKQAPVVVEWFQDAPDAAVITVRAETGETVHAQKRHISRIAVTA